MDRRNRGSEINWAALTLYGSSFIRVLLKHFGYVLDNGVVLVTDNEMAARRFVSEYCLKTKGNGVHIQKVNQREQSLENFQCGFVIMQKGIKDEKINDFLFAQTFLPVLVVGGMLPESLKAERYIFRLKKEDIEEVMSNEFSIQILEFYNYIVKNVNEVCNIIANLDTSILLTEYVGEIGEKNIYSIFAGIGTIYAAFLRKNYSERKSINFLESYMQETKERLHYMAEFACGVEIPEMLSSLVWEYIENNKRILVADIEEIDGKIYAALKSGSVVLFDEKFYYFPPKLLIKICQPFLETVSVPELKRRLRDEGIIYCNSADYTVKKDIVNVYGGKERPRFIWIKKDVLLSPDNLMLENVFSGNEGGKEECREIM